MEWSKLSMPERAEYIRMGVQNGITSLNDIRSTYNKFAERGTTDDDSEDRLISTGNEWLDLGASFIPFVGSSMDIEEAIRNPTFSNIGWATISTASDFLGASLIKGALKSAKAANKARDAINAAEKAAKRYERAVHNATVNPTRGTRRTVRRAFTEMQEANALRRTLAPMVKRRGVGRVPVQRPSIPSDNTRIINTATVYGMDALLNATQNIVE